MTILLAAAGRLNKKKSPGQHGVQMAFDENLVGSFAQGGNVEIAIVGGAPLAWSWLAEAGSLYREFFDFRPFSTILARNRNRDNGSFGGC
jgi:hypothetical protein